MQLTLNRVAAAVVGLAMVVGVAAAFTVERASAAEMSLSELVELFIAIGIIDGDKAEEARAAVAGTETSGGSSSVSCNFTRNLTTGDSGADVMALQKFLNAKGFTVAVTGAGAPGAETEYFGGLTAAAVAAFQEAYASEILAPLGLTAGTGYFGASTRAKANALCSTPGVPSLPGDDDDDMTGDDDDDDLRGGEASLEDFDRLGDPSDEELAEGEEEAQVLGVEFDVEDGDARLSRVDVNFIGVTNSECGAICEDEPWRSLDSVELWLGDDMIASENADDEDDWSNQGGDVYQMRFSGLSEILEEGDTYELYVSVTVGSIDDSRLDQSWMVSIDVDGIRARDGAGIDQYIGDTAVDPSTAADAETFTIEEAGANTELKITTSTANPESSVIKVEENDKTDDVTVLVFDLEAEDGEVTINDIMVYATTSTTTLASVIADAALDIDGFVFRDMEWDDDCDGTASGSGAVQGGCMLFDLQDNDDEQTFDSETVEVSVMLDLKRQSGNYVAGDTIEVDVRAADVDIWEVDDVDSDSLPTTDRSGSADGEVHELQVQGIYAEIVSTDADLRTINNGTEDVVDFEIKFDLTAFEDTFYVGSSTTFAITYHVEKDLATIGTASTTGAVLTSTATEESNGNFRINDGATETFTFQVTVDPDLTGSYRVVLDAVNYSATNAGTVDDLTHSASPVQDFRTPSQSVSQ